MTTSGKALIGYLRLLLLDRSSQAPSYPVSKEFPRTGPPRCGALPLWCRGEGQVAWLLAAAPFIKSRTWPSAPGAFEDGTLRYRDIGKMIELAIYPSARRRRAEGHDPERSQQPGKCRYTCFSHFESTFKRYTPSQYARVVGKSASSRTC
jgi:hypothetical protein